MTENNKILIFEDSIDEITNKYNLSVFFDKLHLIIEQITSFRNEQILTFGNENDLDNCLPEPHIINLSLVGTESKRYANIYIKTRPIIDGSNIKMSITVSELDKAEVNDYVITIDRYSIQADLVSVYNSDTGITLQYNSNNQ